MRKIILILTILMLVSCTVNQKEKNTEVSSLNGKTKNYICSMNENFIVEYSSNGEEAKLFDGANNTYELKSALSVMEEKYYKNNEDVSIHETNGYLAVEIAKDKIIKCEELNNL